MFEGEVSKTRAARATFRATLSRVSPTLEEKLSEAYGPVDTPP